MASEGPNSPSTVVDDTSVGGENWAGVDSIKSSNNSYAEVSAGVSTDDGEELEMKVIKPDGSLGSENKATIGSSLPSSETYESFGGGSDLWSESWNPSDINDSNFGVAIRVQWEGGSATSSRLKASNFGFSIPSGATIDGIEVEPEWFWSGTFNDQVNVDHIRITVYYTEAPDRTFSGTVTDPQESAVQGAEVAAVNNSNDSIEDTDTTDASGNYSLTVASGNDYHLTTQHEDGQSNRFNAVSKPYVTADQDRTSLDFTLIDYTAPAQNSVDFTLDTTETATDTAATANPLTATETAITTETATTTTSVANTLTAVDEPVTQATGVLTTANAAPQTTAETSTTDETATATTVTADPLTSEDTRTVTDTAITTEATTVPLNSTETAVITETAELTVSTANTLTTTEALDINAATTPAQTQVLQAVTEAVNTDTATLTSTNAQVVQATTESVMHETSQLTETSVQTIESFETSTANDTATLTLVRADEVISTDFIDVELAKPLKLNITTPDTELLINTPDTKIVMQDKTFKKDDLGDDLQATLQEEDGTVIDLTNADSVNIVMQNRKRENVLDEPVTITDAGNGEIRYNWSSGDPINTTGTYRLEARIDWGADGPQRIPNNDFAVIEVESNLD